MRRGRQVLAVVIVTTALCADQVATAATIVPQGSALDRACGAASDVAEFAGRLVSRLSHNLRHTVPAVARLQPHARLRVLSQPVRSSQDHVLAIGHRSLSPFQFRLPPPIFG